MKQTLYYVKLGKDTTAGKDQNLDGYLGFNTPKYKEKLSYTRGQALIKAFAFNGTIEKVLSVPTNNEPKNNFVDFKLLSKQKSALIDILSFSDLSPKYTKYLDGILNMLDSLTDNPELFASELLKTIK